MHHVFVISCSWFHSIFTVAMATLFLDTVCTYICNAYSFVQRVVLQFYRGKRKVEKEGGKERKVKEEGNWENVFSFCVKQFVSCAGPELLTWNKARVCQIWLVRRLLPTQHVLEAQYCAMNWITEPCVTYRTVATRVWYIVSMGGGRSLVLSRTVVELVNNFGFL